MRNTLFYQRLRIGLSAAAFIGAVFGPGGQSAFAAGTTVGTTISNLSTLSYKVGTVSQTDIGSSAAGNTSGAGTATSFIVDAKINLTVAKSDAAIISAGPGTSGNVTTFSVTNTSNTALDFSLSSVQAATGQANPFAPTPPQTDSFDTTCSQFVESGATAGYQPAQDTATFIDELAADASKTVYVVCSIPATQADKTVSVVALLATGRGTFSTTAYTPTVGSLGAALTQTAGANTANVDIVFADGAGSDDPTGARDAAFSARDAYQVASAQISVQKTATVVCDPFNGSSNQKQIPGSIVRWSIVISNSASAGASATLATVADTLDNNTTFDVNLVTGAGAPATATSCTSAGGVPESASGTGFRLTTVGSRTTTATKYMTSASDGDGATYAANSPPGTPSTVAIDYALALPAQAGYTAGELKPGESVTVYFNATVQ